MVRGRTEHEVEKWSKGRQVPGSAMERKICRYKTEAGQDKLGLHARGHPTIGFCCQKPFLWDIFQGGPLWHSQECCRSSNPKKYKTCHLFVSILILELGSKQVLGGLWPYSQHLSQSQSRKHVNHSNAFVTWNQSHLHLSPIVTSYKTRGKNKRLV